ncbi:T9SS type A sorting domain-containing protein, partial [candidate division WOR-3 bacterium]|nr:T9SS type A sorting domain-containing protein [candidate division WOR-3 bacterium]
LDISDPTNPKEISHYDTKSRSNSIITRDSIAYVADSASVLLLNIKNPYNPQMISELPLICNGFGMVLDYPYLYVTSELTHDFTIVNVSNPENPFITGSFHLNGFPTYICYKDTFAFVSVSLEGIAVINTANVYNPTLVTYLQLPGYARGNVCKGNFLYVATEDSSLICIVNLTDPSTPILENTVNTIQDYPFSITVSDTLLYVAEQFSGIEVFNISSSPSIQSVGYYIGDPLCIPLGITSEVGLAYLAADNGVFIFQYTGCSQIEANEIKRIGLKFPISLRCYPSTFSERVTIEITSVNEENIKLGLFDIMGRNIKDIFTGRMKGKRFFEWNGLNKNGDRVSSGIYFLRMWTENDNIQKKIIFIRN